MALYYSIVFGILSAEIIAFFLFLLPVPTRWQKPIFRWFATSPAIAHAQYIMRVVFAFIFVLFLDAMNTLKAFYEVVNAEEETNTPTMGTTDFRAQVGQAAKKFYAQRNLYLTGFTMLLLLILNKIKNMTLEYIELEDQFIELQGATTHDPAVKEASEKIDTEPIERKQTKLESVEQKKKASESRKDI